MRRHRANELLALSAVRLASSAGTADGLEEFVHDASRALDSDAVTLVARGIRGEPELVVASTPETAVLELDQVELEQGPSIDVLSTGVVVSGAKDDLRRRWPGLGLHMAASDLRAVTAVPLLWNETVVGSLSAWRSRPEPLDGDERETARSFAALATLALGARGATDRLTTDVVSALNARVVVEQAKGVLADRLSTDVDSAHDELRELARLSGTSVEAAARALLNDDPRRR